MRTNNHKYENVHGKSPRGRGMWIFELLLEDGTKELMSAHGTLTEAKKRVIDDYRRLAGNTSSIEEIIVMP